MLSSLYLSTRCLLGIYERHANARKRARATPIPLPEKPTLSTRDVSVLVPTINTPDAFTECMRLWLANEPKEIIIVTVPRDLPRLNELLDPLLQASSPPEVPISVFTVPQPGRRAQMSLALRKAAGKVVVYVDDDTYWPSNKVLPSLLAGLEDPAVGGVTSRQSALVPPHRRKPNIITASEVATMRALASSSDSNETAFVADGTVWCLTGRTMVVRAEALQPQHLQPQHIKNGNNEDDDENDFCHALTHETWAGKPINTGDDGFVTHWLLNRGWRITFQSAPEAEVLTLVEDAPNFARQLVRWRRSGFRTHSRLILHEPGFWALRRVYPGFAVKCARFLVRPLSTLILFSAWVDAIWRSPHVALLIAMYHLYRFITTSYAFHAKNPWVGYRHLWAVVAMDNVYQFINLYVVLTLGVEGWLTRDDGTAK